MRTVCARCSRAQEAGDCTDGPERMGPEPRLFGDSASRTDRALRTESPWEPAIAESVSNRRILRQKSAYHPETKQDFTVAQLIERMGTHGASHLEQIERLKREAAGLSS